MTQLKTLLNLLSRSGSITYLMPYQVRVDAQRSAQHS